LPARFTYSHTALRWAEFFQDDEDAEHDTDFNPDMLSDDGLYTNCCVVMRLTFILKTKAADRAILQLMTSIDRKTWDFGDYYYIYLCIIKEQRSDCEGSK
jgi:hypothetical protein